MAPPSNFGQLTKEQWDRLQEYLDRLEQAWDSANPRIAAVDLRDWLPPAGDPLRSAALLEMIKTELEIRWRRGHGLALEKYLERFPELGNGSTLPTALLYEEYRVRQRFGDQPPLSAYRERFPEQFAELERLVREQPVPPPPPPRLPKADAGVHVPDITSCPDLPISTGYRLVQHLRRGAFGEVWRAEAPGGVEVAVKIIFGSVADKQGQRELQALELIKRLRHPFLLPIHAFWQFEDRLIIAMELADGSLRDRADARHPTDEPGVPPEELLRYFREAAEALDYLHEKHVLHRDIKPENILLLEGHAKVADFDLVRVVEQTRRLITGSFCGTMAYTAPEVFWRGLVGAGSDQYSLAVTYAELRLNRPLFPTKNYFQLMNDHLQRSPDLVPLLEPEQRVVRKALAKDPDDRYRSCREFVQALERVVPR